MRPFLKTGRFPDLEQEFLLEYPGADKESNPDIVVAFGGDGTLFHLVKEFRHLNVPFFVIAAGTVNFLTNKVEDLKLNPEIKKVSLMKCTIGNEIHYALNDVVIGDNIMDYNHFVIKTENEIYKTSGMGLCISSIIGATAFNKNNNGKIISLYDDEILSLTSVVCNKTIRRLCSSIEIFIDKEMEQRATPKIYLDGKTKVLDFKDIKIELDGEIQLAFNNVRDLNLKRLNS